LRFPAEIRRRSPIIISSAVATANAAIANETSGKTGKSVNTGILQNPACAIPTGLMNCPHLHISPLTPLQSTSLRREP